MSRREVIPRGNINNHLQLAKQLFLKKRLSFFKELVEQTWRKAYAAFKIHSPFIQSATPNIFLYKVPVWGSTANGQKLEIVEKHCLKRMEGLHATEMRGEDFYRIVDVFSPHQLEENRSNKFFGITTNQNTLTRDIEV